MSRHYMPYDHYPEYKGSKLNHTYLNTLVIDYTDSLNTRPIIFLAIVYAVVTFFVFGLTVSLMLLNEPYAQLFLAPVPLPPMLTAVAVSYAVWLIWVAGGLVGGASATPKSQLRKGTVVGWCRVVGDRRRR